MHTIVHYEVYVQEQRGWELHSRHPSAERSAALEEAKGIEQYTGKSVRVIRETYFPTLNSSEEIVAYVSPHAGRHSRLAEGGGGGLDARGASRSTAGGWLQEDPFAIAVGASENARRSPSTEGRNRGPIGTGGILVRLTGIITGCLGLAAVATMMTSMALDRMPTIGRASGDNADILFPVFMAVFMLSTIPLVITFVPVTDPNLPSGARRRSGDSLWARLRGWFQPKRPDADDDGGRADAPPEIPPDRLADLDMDLDLAPATLDLDDFDEASSDPEHDHPLDLSLDLGASDDHEEDAPDSNAEGTASDDRDGREPKAAEDTLDASDASDPRRVLVAFLGGALAEVQKARPQLDAFNRFGLNLVVYGGCDALMATARIDPADIRPLVMETARILGVPQAAAAQFHARLDTYLAEPKYLRMVQAGRIAMQRFSTGGGAQAFADLPSAFEAWNAPLDAPVADADAPAQRITTVMFTDIVGSTALTQEQGDRAAHRFIRVHNTIARDVLARFNGREVKHTGDGIMAAFASAGAAVQAAIEIQQAVAAHGGESPADAFWLRIGLNSGEPLEEEDDLFGTTVQLAARVCARAGPGEILISNVLRELCAGKPFTTRDRGMVKLKGFTEPQRLHEVVWTAAGTPGATSMQAGSAPATDGGGQVGRAADRHRSNVA